MSMKPMASREYPPARPRRDIVLKDVRHTPLSRKMTYPEVSADHSPLKLAEKISLEASAANDLKKHPTTDAGSSRKAYYEKWDKFDVEQALEDFESKKAPAMKGGSSVKSTSNMTLGKSSNKSSTDPTEISKPLITPVTAVQAPRKDMSAANAEKEKGNELFKKGQYAKAIDHYSASISLDPTNAVLPINRAMALLKLKRFAEAEKDCTLGLKLDNKNVKALWRRGIARRSLGNESGARDDFELALTFDPANKAVKEELAKLAPPPKVSLAKDAAVVAPAPTKVKAQDVTNASTTAPVISSKRIKIKELDSAHGSTLFPPPTSKAAIKTNPADPEPVVPETNSARIPASTVTAVVQPSRPIPKLQMVVPTTAMEFQRDWKSYSKSNSLLYQYIKLIEPEKFLSIFKSSFESDYLSSMLSVFREFYLVSEDPALLFRTLQNLAKVQRFDMALMFMSSKDKEDLLAIFKHLAAQLNAQKYQGQDLASLASKYKTKY